MIWLENGCKWSQARLTESFVKATKEVDGSIQALLTEGQLSDLYKDPIIAAEIKKKKNKHLATGNLILRSRMWQKPLNIGVS